MISDFKVNTTKAFDIYYRKNGILQDISMGVVEIIFKKKQDDLDSEAVIHENAIEQTDKGKARFLLTSTVTNVEPRNYYVSIRWQVDDNQYILLDDTINILKRTFDVD